MCGVCSYVQINGLFLAPDVAAATVFSFLLICVFNPDSELILVSISH